VVVLLEGTKICPKEMETVVWVVGRDPDAFVKTLTANNKPTTR
jgi:hypothetical protein